MTLKRWIIRPIKRAFYYMRTYRRIRRIAGAITIASSVFCVFNSKMIALNRISDAAPVVVFAEGKVGEGLHELGGIYQQVISSSVISEETSASKENADISDSETAQFSLSDIPPWDGETPYVFLSGNDVIIPETYIVPDYGSDMPSSYDICYGNPYFTEQDLKDTDTSWITYDPLDSLDRRGVATACVGLDLMPTVDRGDISDIKPSGWTEAQYYAHKTSSDLVLNRCHLIAYCLAGRDEPELLVTGTRRCNLAMLPFEITVANFIKSTGEHVLYRATPVYRESDDLIPSGILLEAQSIESSALSFCAYVYNEDIDIYFDHASGYSE